MHALRHILLGLAALAGLPAAASAQNAFFVESIELGGLKFFLSNKGVQKEVKLKANQGSTIGVALDRVPLKYARERQMLALYKRANKQEEYDKLLQKVKKAMVDDKIKILEQNLKDDQMKRFKEVAYQVAVVGALTQPGVQTKLGLTSDQQDKLKANYQEFLNQRNELRKKLLPRGKYEQYRKDWVALHDEAKKKALEVLTDDQKQTWKSMTGKPFNYKPTKIASPQSGY
jgi:hypothetical protein